MNSGPAPGKNSNLPGRFENGTTRWHKVLDLIRFGARPTVRELLTIMRQDFPMNEKLRLYATDRDIIGWR